MSKLIAISPYTPFAIIEFFCIRSVDGTSDKSLVRMHHGGTGVSVRVGPDTSCEAQAKTSTLRDGHARLTGNFDASIASTCNKVYIKSWSWRAKAFYITMSPGSTKAKWREVMTSEGMVPIHQRFCFRLDGNSGSA